MVERGREESVVAGAELERGDLVGVALEVANVRVVVGGEVADVVVEFGRGVDDRLRVVGEAGKGGAVLLRLEFLCVGAGLCVVDVQSVVGAGKEEQLAGRVEVERGVVQVGGFEELRQRQARQWLRLGMQACVTGTETANSPAWDDTSR